VNTKNPDPDQYNPDQSSPEQAKANTKNWNTKHKKNQVHEKTNISEKSLKSRHIKVFMKRKVAQM
jgi:hypothetical protein